MQKAGSDPTCDPTCGPTCDADIAHDRGYSVRRDRHVTGRGGMWKGRPYSGK